MDELLASIREIIEESAGAATPSGVDVSRLDGDGHDVPVPDHVNKPDESILRNAELPSDGTKGAASKQQDIPVQDAMNALAERIGLRRQMDEPIKSEKAAGMTVGSGLTPVFPYVSDAATNVSPFPSEKVVSPLPAPVKVEAKPVGGHIAKESNMISASSLPLPSRQPASGQSLSVQAADKKSQQLPFQTQMQPPSPPNSAIKARPQRKGSVQQPPSPPIARAPQQPPVSPEKRGVPVNTLPIGVSPSGTPLAQQPISQPFQMQPFPLQMPQQPPAIKSRADISQTEDVKGKWAELEKDFRVEFEKSAELLLRPYIAQWLDEHFHHLFEKILREEIQRMLQNLHR